MSKPLLAALVSLVALSAPADGLAKLTSSARECEMSIRPSRRMFSAFHANETTRYAAPHADRTGPDRCTAIARRRRAGPLDGTSPTNTA